MKFTFLVWMGIVHLAVACNSNPTTAQKVSQISISENTTSEKQEILPSMTSDTVLYLPFESHSIKISIYPTKNKEFKGSILALPGWNFPATQWCDSTSLCRIADSLGYTLVLPEMGKSIYCATTYPETRKDWRQYPTRTWITKTLIPHLQDTFNVLLKTQSNYVMGLSTGARGAALIALDHPELFKACALLSGDYDQTKYPKDNLYKGFYGAFSLFPARWKENDNIITAISKFTVPAYIAHGKKDKIVPVEHSHDLFDNLDALKKDVTLHIAENAHHNYAFWNTEVPLVIGFFQEHP